MQVLTPEILNQIFNDVATMERAREQHRVGLRTMLVLARTARMFQHTALNIIWRTLPSIAPLFHTLPPDLWKVQEHPRPRRDELCFTRPLEAADLARFHHHARRVRFIVIRHDPECSHLSLRIRHFDIAPTVYDTLASIPGPRPLLPNLECLHIRAQSGMTVQIAATFFGPGLVDVKLMDSIEIPRFVLAEEDEGKYAGMLAQLARQCSRLRDFRFTIYTHHPLIANAVSSALCNFHSLTNLGVKDTPMQIEAFVHLARLPDLRLMHALLEFPQDALTSLLHDTASVRFPALRNVHLAADTLSLITTLLHVIQSPCISTIELRAADEGVSNRSLRHVFSALANHQSSTQIRDMTLDFGAGECRAEPLDEPTFEPLLALPNITALALDVYSKAVLCDHFIYRIARAWPQLRVLEIGVEHAYTTGPPPRATIAAFGTLSALCPDLDCLGLEVDGCASTYALAGCPAAQTGLHTLQVGYSKIRDEAEVAVYLSRAFPMLEAIDVAWASENHAEEIPQRRAWAKVTDLILEFALVRTQERNWAGFPDSEGPEDERTAEFLERLRLNCMRNCPRSSIWPSAEKTSSLGLEPQ